MQIPDEKRKIEIIEQYMPKQMSEEEVKELINSLKIDKNEKAGQVIGRVMSLVKGKADGKMVQRIVRVYLQN